MPKITVMYIKEKHNINQKSMFKVKYNCMIIFSSIYEISLMIMKL